MKNVFPIIICFLMAQSYGQETKSQKNQNSKIVGESKDIMAQEPTKEIVLKKRCPVEGYVVTLSRDIGTSTGVSEKRYIQVAGTRKSYYTTAANAASLPGFQGLPQPGQEVVSNTASGYLSLQSVDVDSEKKYCDEHGYRLIPANGPIYKVSIGSNNQGWSGSVTITSGGHLDSASIWLLVQTYNNKRGFTASEKVPMTCVSSCRNAGDDSVDPDNPFDDRPTTSFVDASGEVHDWFDNDGGNNGGGKVTPVLADNILHEQISLNAGGSFGSFNNSDYINRSFGGHLGGYFPIISSKNISYGVYASVDYLHSNKDSFKHQPVGFEVSGMDHFVKKSSEKSLEQDVFILGVGPQANYKISNKMSASVIVQAGVISFEQSGFAFIQEFKEGDASIPVEILNQKETKSTNFFMTPKLRLSYALSSRVGVWAEGNYMMGEIKTNQTVLNPGEPSRDDGAYTFSQINNAEQVERKNEYNLSGIGFSFGLSFSLFN